MIVEEKVNEELVRHYSDAGKIILQVETNTEYYEAVDVIPCKYTYAETDTALEGSSEEATIDDYRAALADMGVSV